MIQLAPQLVLLKLLHAGYLDPLILKCLTLVAFLQQYPDILVEWSVIILCSLLFTVPMLIHPGMLAF